ncbi:sigma-70 family RNA polymerase sigma factor [Streptomyces sp. JJ38]|uniref:sigma-70 family RNA polymerase sigma factor n=1 Tax=Streptomyces sp. JJ38 TaxID=2738128 RepID=UPI001C56D24C|nr:sigma-70 family RNA polymerase sigma factor [Streptomyces sp. JJ38]MBW1599462.1 sigma-70 family RNA polymerase sigma factor [Streptomyces sp. JJ38]
MTQLSLDLVAFHRQRRPAFVRRAERELNNRADAEEVVDLAFEQIALSWPKILSMASPAAYAWSILRNRIKDRIKARGHTLDRTLLYDNLAFETLALRTAVDPIGELEESLALAEAVAALPERQRDVIILYYYECYPVAAIAEYMGIAPATVRSTQRNALRRLKGALTPEREQTP